MVVSERERQRLELQKRAYDRMMGRVVERPAAPKLPAVVPVQAAERAPEKIVEEALQRIEADRPPLPGPAVENVSDDEVRKALAFYRKHLESSRVAQKKYRAKKKEG